MAKGKGTKRTKAAGRKKADGLRLIYILSDSTGNLARHMLTAFLTQFPADTFEVRIKTFVDTEERLRQALEEVGQTPGIVFHAVISDKAKRLIEAHSKAVGAPVCDLTGGFVDFLTRESGIEPAADPARLHHVNEGYRRRIRAVEFALEHDDGLGLDTLHQADVVLAGVSRTSKTPTCMYLAQQGYYVGNVPLAMGTEPPRQLLGLPRAKVVGLTIDSLQLSEIRTRRQKGWGMASTAYNDPMAVDEEIKWARRLFTQQGWEVLDVTNQAIEETAARVVNRARLPRALNL